MTTRIMEDEKKYSVGERVFLPLPTEEDTSSKKVQSGLEFILNHFEEPHFPRTLSTVATNNKQHEVSDKDRAMLYYQGALWEDCRIAAFRIGQENPDLIFIDLDAQDFSSMRAFELALTRTLKNIKQKIGGTPTLLWSGRGYHLLQPISCPIALETISELKTLEPNNTSNKFLQFAETYLSGRKRDKSHHPALKSCQLRIPGSFNSRCKAAGVDPKVKILQRWDGHRPSYKLLLGSFYADLISKNMPTYREIQKRQKMRSFGIPSDVSSRTISWQAPITWWIEKLLQTPIEDYRKRARDLILVPYLVVRKSIEDENQVTSIVMGWADKCAELRPLEPSRHEFENRTWNRVQQSIHDKIPPMRLSTLQERNPELYEEVILSEKWQR
jgi:hypothetical protein